MISEIDQLEDVRPELPSERSVVSEAERSALLQRITATPRDERGVGAIAAPTRAHRGRRWGLGAVVAALAAAVLVLGLALPGGTPGGPDSASAAALRRIADIAAGEAGPVAGSAQVAFADFTSTQLSSGPDRSSRTQQWQSADGTVRYRIVETSIEYSQPVGCYLRRPSDSTLQGASLDRLRSLPTDPAALRSVLTGTPAVANSGAPASQALLKELVNLLTNAIAPPSLRAAAIRVLALDTAHVSIQLDDSDSQGRAATAVTFEFDEFSSGQAGQEPTRVGPSGRAQTLYFDPATSHLLQISSIFNGAAEAETTYLEYGVADEVPPELLACLTAK